MKQFSICGLVGVALIFATQGSPVFAANPILVSYTVTGNPGNWTLDFSVTNNMTATPDLSCHRVE
jgi:hypothetical protein